MASGDQSPTTIDGWEVTGYMDAVRRLSARFPDRRVTQIEAVLAREHDAFTGGRPVAIPIEVEEGAAEILERDAPANAGASAEPAA